jgi:hypothetical protein
VKLYQYNDLLGILSMLSSGGLLNEVNLFFEDLEKNTDYYNENNQ